MNMRTAPAALTLAAALCTFGATAQADVIYGTNAIGASPRTSDYGTVTGSGFRTFDNFTSASNASIERLSWRGLWLGEVTPAPAPAPLVDSWLISFHSSSGGTPGALLWSQSVAAANVAGTFRGAGVLSAGSTYNVNYFDYALDLPAAFDILAGEEYWVSVTAIADTFYPAFAVLGATGGDDSSYQQTLGANMSVSSATNVARDRAFTIEGTLQQVPEPGTLALGGIAFAAMAGLRSRRRPTPA